MHFWNTNALIQELREEKLTERGKMKYALALFLLGNVFFYGAQGLYSSTGFLLVLEMLAVLAITVGGVVWCYLTNAKGDNKSFVERFIVLSLPITIRLFVLGFIVYVAYVILGFIILGEVFDTFVERYTTFDLLFIVVFEALFYVWLRLAIVKVSKIEP